MIVILAFLRNEEVNTVNSLDVHSRSDSNSVLGILDLNKYVSNQCIKNIHFSMPNVLIQQIHSH